MCQTVEKEGRENLGRPADLTPEKITHARQMIDSGQQSVTGMAKIIGVHRVTLHKALKWTGYAPDTARVAGSL